MILKEPNINKPFSEYNKKGHKHLATLIKAVMNLIDDKLFLNELFIDHGFTGDEFRISDKSEFDTVAKITIQFERLIPEILEEFLEKEIVIPKRRPLCFQLNYMSENKTAENIIFETKDKKQPRITDESVYKFDEEFYSMLGLLHELILKDYSVKGNSSILLILIKYNISPISLTTISRIRSSAEDNEVKNIKEIKHIQRFIKSVNRKKTHSTLFGEIPSRDCLIPKNIAHHSRIVKVIHELTANHSIINIVQHHWTTESNLKSIVRMGFYGNKTLRKQRIFFRENSLGSGDVKNGDANVICFCPYMVDLLTFRGTTTQHLKKDLVRLAVNLEKSDSYGHFNQFFKLFDLWSPAFVYKVQISQDLALTLVRKSRGKDVTLTLTLKGENETLNLFDGSNSSKNNLFCYGNLYTINRYCLIVLFRFLNASKNNTFENNFINYLLTCKDDEIKKILIIIAQSLTVFAEYNFNSSLPLSDDFIHEIYYVDKAFKYHFPELGSKYYRAIFDLVMHKNMDPQIKKTQESLFTSYKDGSILSLYGNQIDLKEHVVTFQEQDFSHVLPKLFNEGSYIETRPQTSKLTLLEQELQKKSANQTSLSSRS